MQRLPAVACALALCVLVAAAADMPEPFSDILKYGDSGKDVEMLQFLLRRASPPPVANSKFDDATESAVKQFQRNASLNVDGIFGPLTARAAMKDLTPDGYVDDGQPPSATGHLYKIVIPVHRNRSVQSIASLHAANGTKVFEFHARLHGYNGDDVARPWPNFNNTDDGLTQFASNGNTPTGLIEADLNTPEDEPKLYGPYDVNRAVRGLRGNALFLVPNVRDGILVHTGEWPGWHAPMIMPNSEGCIHAWPQEIDTIAKTLKAMGVVAHKNTNGKLPYPYRTQGLLSIYLVD